ncbi:hypothetical protein [Cognatiyoonia sp. IB215182]|uniref:hypothetical protein n=1 Tax=Cognatiyoonia sp. IB215182 TaxID=3097353 RepID=UPI002A169D03|nr:hypothetical protein [Cognatiyoonia sp. IB215182]MDX8352966.1 hypothetical protein [Cognatiyoonia sp. IB215182]
MTDLPEPSLVAQLLSLEPVKTWSLIVTVFGDMDGDRISGKDLGALLGPLGIRPEAMRVALHRLKKDGWIQSEKSGREVIYSLSPYGRAETTTAREDVYRRDAKFADEGWIIAVLPPGATAPEGPHVTVDRGLYVVPARQNILADALILEPTGALPTWIEASLVPDHMRAQAGELVELTAKFQDHLSAGHDGTHLRLMFLHLWRKMALRPGTWAHIGLMPDGVMARCHAAMVQFFAQTQPTPSSGM